MQFVSILLTVVTGIIIVDAILSWVAPPNSPIRTLTRNLTAPLYAPVHAVLPPSNTGGMDFSPIVLLVAINILRRVLGV